MPASDRSPLTAIARSAPPSSAATLASASVVGPGQHQPRALGGELLGAGAAEPRAASVTT